jgi:hypothetical protein
MYIRCRFEHVEDLKTEIDKAIEAILALRNIDQQITSQERE